MDDASDQLVMPKTVSSLWRDLVGSVLPLQWNSSRHKCKSWSMVGAVLLVPVGRDRLWLDLGRTSDENVYGGVCIVFSVVANTGDSI